MPTRYDVIIVYGNLLVELSLGRIVLTDTHSTYKTVFSILSLFGRNRSGAFSIHFYQPIRTEPLEIDESILLTSSSVSVTLLPTEIK
jgi:hypothetical protein